MQISKKCVRLFALIKWIRDISFILWLRRLALITNDAINKLIDIKRIWEIRYPCMRIASLVLETEIIVPFFFTWEIVWAHCSLIKSIAHLMLNLIVSTFFAIPHVLEDHQRLLLGLRVDVLNYKQRNIDE